MTRHAVTGREAKRDTAPSPGGEHEGTAPQRDYRELRRRVQAAGLLEPQSRSFAINLIITAAIIAGCTAFVVRFHGAWGLIVGAILMGVASVQLAYVVHDAGHRQGFVRRWQNFLVGLIGANLLLGASYGWWVKKHNQHHAHPNHADLDPDIDLPLIAFTPEQAEARRGALRWVARHQVYFAVPLLTLVAYAQRLGSVLFLLRERSTHRRLEGVALILNGALTIGLPLYFFGFWPAVLFVTVYQAMTGLYLGLVFAPNHKGMEMVDADTDMDSVRAQVLTARNVRPNPVTDWVYGGLNYQIEHHLFPSLSRNRLGAARRIVRAFCAERGIPYHETSIPRSYVEIMASLRAVSRTMRPRHAG